EADYYLWSNGDRENNITIYRGGFYMVEARNSCGIFSDSISIIQGCACTAYIPTAFTPNGDGVNDIFRVNMNCSVLNEFTFYIFNRWGQRIFISNNLNEGWDGTYGGQPAATGVYYY